MMPEKKGTSSWVIFIFLFFCYVLYMNAASISEYMTILWMYVKNPYEVGELAPLSKSASEYIIKFIEPCGESKHYLEVGAGCGAITAHIIPKLRSSDHLDLVEINSTMCKMLEQRFAKYKNVSIYCCSIFDFKPLFKYDAIVSTLPFNSFDEAFAKKVMDFYHKITKKEHTLSYVEYAVVSNILQYFFTSQGRKEFQGVQKYLSGVRKQYGKEEKTVYFNFPPVNVFHLSF